MQLTQKMQAIGLTQYLPIDNLDSMIDIEAEIPQPNSRDILVKVLAIAVNPLDTKVRKPKDKVEAIPKILGWDAAGEVVAIGDAVSLFKVGDLVCYAGDITRDGSNAQYQIVDERIAGHKPQTLDMEAAAALPLTAITAWEALFDRLLIPQQAEVSKHKTILIIGAAGGVGSIAIQLAKKSPG